MKRVITRNTQVKPPKNASKVPDRGVISPCPSEAVSDPFKPCFIAAADLHLRDDVPVCRTDDYLRAQQRKFGALCQAARDYHCPLLIAGDVFDSWRPSHRLVAEVIEQSRGLTVVAVPGQHDLPQHNLALLGKSGLGVLEAHGWHVLRNGLVDRIIDGITIAGYAFGEVPPKGASPDIILWHVMTWVKEQPYPNCPAPRAVALLKKYHNVRLILTGDNHSSFIEELFAGGLLINPGSMMRMATDQLDHKPCFYLIGEQTKTRSIPFAIEQGVISDAHIQREHERDAKMEAFVKRVADDAEVGLSFEENMQRFLEANKTSMEVRAAVLRAMEE